MKRQAIRFHHDVQAVDRILAQQLRRKSIEDLQSFDDDLAAPWVWKSDNVQPAVPTVNRDPLGDPKVSKVRLVHVTAVGGHVGGDFIRDAATVELVDPAGRDAPQRVAERGLSVDVVQRIVIIAFVEEEPCQKAILADLRSVFIDERQ